MRNLTEPTGLDSLTEHQRRLVRLYSELGSYKAVAHRMGTSYPTARHTGQAVLRRLDVGTITQACLLLDRSER